MREAVQYIHNGLDRGIVSGVSCMVEAIPYCMMQGYKKYISEKKCLKPK